MREHIFAMRQKSNLFLLQQQKQQNKRSYTNTNQYQSISQDSSATYHALTSCDVVQIKHFNF